VVHKNAEVLRSLPDEGEGAERDAHSEEPEEVEGEGDGRPAGADGAHANPVHAPHHVVLRARVEAEQRAHARQRRQPARRQCRGLLRRCVH